MKTIYNKSCVLVVLCSSISMGQAQIETLFSGNSSVSINTSSQQGMYNWSVDGQNQLAQQWFWYRIGSTGPDASINTISAPVITPVTAGILETTYANSSLQVNVLYSLLGGAVGSGASDISEQISIQNLGASALSFHFFQYADFNLAGTANNDSGQLDSVRRTMYGGVTQFDGTGCHISENVDTAVSQPANRAQIGTGSTLLSSLTDGGPTTLNDTTASGGNINWALEWDVTINPGGTLIISKDMNIVGVNGGGSVPEPSTWALVMLGVLSGGCYRYRSSRRMV